ncbi:hypothetical protein K466DRAFT_105727 [Polyporus arcularius HHB13444]|uniref:Uncharacterized protein n=1 Tax=Polyporus arcularius HHB13444 TaxID=1314778 RepID=A0A5C3PCT1_9APHY|nr:hypothetical protein K466DRAFT_105727 [Polyporus arcularius HHB13444]
MAIIARIRVWVRVRVRVRRHPDSGLAPCTRRRTLVPWSLNQASAAPRSRGLDFDPGTRRTKCALGYVAAGFLSAWSAPEMGCKRKSFGERRRAHETANRERTYMSISISSSVSRRVGLTGR